MNLYFGGATNIIAMIAKTFAIYMFSVFIGVSFPRFRVDQSIKFFLKVPTVIGIIAVLIYAI
jgi:NADH-quinone oxidoreductase subunit H